MSHRIVAALLLAASACSQAPAPSQPSRAATVAQPPAALVRDVLPGEGPFHTLTVNWIWNAGPVTYFSATEPSTGTELWRTDGTTEGTGVVADVCPGACGSGPVRLDAIGDVAYFLANDGSHGQELWRTDGTAWGTWLVKDVLPGGGGLSAWGAGGGREAAFGGKVWFKTSGSPEQLWVSDGTEAGTVRLPNANYATWVIGAVGSTVLIAEESCIYNDVIWKSDGTVAGTEVLLTVPTAQPYVHLCPRRGPTTMLQGKLWFGVGSGAWLWSSDGTAAGTVPFGYDPLDSLDVALRKHSDQVTRAGDGLYFVGGYEGDTAKVYRTDGTTLPVALGTIGINPNSFHAVGDHLLFQDKSAATGREWFVADAGTAPRVLYDIRPGAEDGQSSDSGWANLDGIEYFVARDATDYSLWRTDGTQEGTFDAGLTRPNLYWGHIATAGGKLVIAADPARPPGLYVSDGTAAGTQALSIRTTGPGSTNGPLVPDGDVAYFQANDGSGQELWTTNGTGAGTAKLAELVTGTSGDFVVLPLGNGLTLFTFTDPVIGRALWVTDRTAAGTRAVGAPCSDPLGYMGPPTVGVALGGVGVFPALTVADGTEPWRSDGTAAGTYPLLNYAPRSYSSLPRDFTVAAGRIWFTAGNAGGFRAVFVTDGTAAGTYRVGSVAPFTRASGDASIWFAELAGAVYFGGSSGGVAGLYRSDGSGAALVKALDVGSARANVAGGLLLFAADDGTGMALWRSDGTAEGTSLLARAGAISDLVAFGDRVVFSAVDAAHGREPWVSDGTPEGTHVVKDVRPGASGSSAVAAPFVLADAGVALFAASDGVSGAELWATNGTEVGTFLVQDVRQGPLPSTPTSFARVGAWVVFLADDGVHGREPWSLPVASIASMDLLPPVISCPAPVTAETTSASGVAVEVPAATAEDGITLAPIVTSSRASGSVFPVGTTDVTFTATDDAGNSASCTTSVTVTLRETPAAPQSGGCGSGTGTGPLTLLAAGLLAARRLRRRRV